MQGMRAERAGRAGPQSWSDPRHTELGPIWPDQLSKGRSMGRALGSGRALGIPSCRSTIRTSPLD